MRVRANQFAGSKLNRQKLGQSSGSNCQNQPPPRRLRSKTDRVLPAGNAWRNSTAAVAKHRAKLGQFHPDWNQGSTPNLVMARCVRAIYRGMVLV